MKILNYIIFGIVVCVLCYYATQGTAIFIKKINTTTQKINRQIKERPDFVFHEITIVEVSGPKRFWEMKARNSEILKQSILLHEVNGTAFVNGGATFSFQSPYTVVHMNDRTFEGKMVDGIYRDQKKSWHISGTSVCWSPQTYLLIASSGITLNYDTAVITAKKMQAQISKQEFIIEDNVHYDIPQKVDIHADKLRITPAHAAEAWGARIYANQAVASANYIHYSSTANTVLMENAVRFAHEKATITCDYGMWKNQESIIASHNVVFKQDKIFIKSDKLSYDLKNKKAEMTGNLIVYESNKQLYTEKVIVDVAHNKILTEGHFKFVIPKD